MRLSLFPKATNVPNINTTNTASATRMLRKADPLNVAELPRSRRLDDLLNTFKIAARLLRIYSKTPNKSPTSPRYSPKLVVTSFAGAAVFSLAAS
jgi:hypothetical protein